MMMMVFFWSLNFVIVKIALREFPPLLLTALRVALAAGVLLGIFTATRARRRNTRWKAREIVRSQALEILENPALLAWQLLVTGA